MKTKGFTLIELLIVIAIIGIVAAIAVPNLLTALHKSKVKATMGDMKNIATAIEAYITDNSMSPGGGGVPLIADLDPLLTPFYIKVLPHEDAWGEPLHYESGDVTGPNPTAYSIISYGRDGLSTPFIIADSGYVITRMEDFNNDICYSNGAFTYASKIK